MGRWCLSTHAHLNLNHRTMLFHWIEIKCNNLVLLVLWEDLIYICGDVRCISLPFKPAVITVCALLKLHDQWVWQWWEKEKKSTMLTMIIIPIYLCAKKIIIVVDLNFSHRCKFTFVMFMFYWPCFIFNFRPFLDITANGKASSEQGRSKVCYNTVL